MYSKTVSSTLTLERETLHISDDTGRIALIDTRTTGSGTEPAQLLRYQYSNHLSTATLELDDAAAIISYEEYYPYGSTSFQCGRSGAEVSLKRYRYTGKERDEETGLYYHGARYYVPWLARWVSTDPINNENYNLNKGYGIEKNKERDFLELTASPYEYCYDNPVIYDDSTGEPPPPTQYSSVDHTGIFTPPEESYKFENLQLYSEPEAKKVTIFTPDTTDNLKVSHQKVTGTVEGLKKQKMIAAASQPQAIITARKQENAYEQQARRSAEFQVKMLQASQGNPLIGAFSFAASDIVGTIGSGYNSYDNFRQGHYFAGTAYAGLTLLAVEGYGGGAFGKVSKELSIAGEEGKTILYRAVSQAELDDIAIHGIRNAPGYETGKLFATSAQDAANFGRLNYGLDKQPFTIIKTSIPNKYSSMLYRGEMDLMQSVSVPKNLFNQLSKPGIFNKTPLPNHPLIR